MPSAQPTLEERDREALILMSLARLEAERDGAQARHSYEQALTIYQELGSTPLVIVIKMRLVVLG